MYGALALATITLGLWVHLRGTSLNADLRDVLGDALWASMMVWIVSAMAPRASVATRGSAALAICVAVELSQLVHARTIDAMRGTTLGRLVLGSGFDVRDLVAYTIGVVTALAIERYLRRRFVQTRVTERR